MFCLIALSSGRGVSCKWINQIPPHWLEIMMTTGKIHKILFGIYTIVFGFFDGMVIFRFKAIIFFVVKIERKDSNFLFTFVRFSSFPFFVVVCGLHASWYLVFEISKNLIMTWKLSQIFSIENFGIDWNPLAPKILNEIKKRHNY